jgi:hypothetical protein
MRKTNTNNEEKEPMNLRKAMELAAVSDMGVKRFKIWLEEKGYSSLMVTSCCLTYMDLKERMEKKS